LQGSGRTGLHDRRSDGGSSWICIYLLDHLLSRGGMALGTR
jgi:hypothetical protein